MYSQAQIEANLNSTLSHKEDIYGGIVDISLWWDVKDKKEALAKKKHLDLSTVKYMSLDENMFSTLPTMYLEIVDAGGTMSEDPIIIGRELFIEIQPKAKKDVEKRSSPVFIASKIESFYFKTNSYTGATVYHVNCVLSATAFVNKVITYPEKVAGDTLGLAEKSTDVVKNVAGLGGLSVACDISTVDSMHWINNSLTCKDFVDKVVNHSWIAEDDATLFYVTLNGWGHYTSIKTMCNNQNVKNIILQSKLDHKIRTEGADKAYSDYLEPQAQIIASDIKFINTGSRTQNIGGGIHQSVFYDNGWGTVSKLILGLYPKKASAPDMLNVGLTERPNTRYVKFDGQGDQIYIGGQTNNDSQVARSIREKKFEGVHFDTTHLFYDFAESNNKAIKLGFFQQFWKITITCSKQFAYFYNDDEMIPQVGDVCDIDFGIQDKENKVYSGKYVVTRVEHMWSENNAYSIVLTVCSDGLHLKKQTCPFFETCSKAGSCKYQKQFEQCAEYQKQLEKKAVEEAVEENEDTADKIEKSTEASKDEGSANKGSQKPAEAVKPTQTSTTNKTKPKNYAKNTTTQKKANQASREENSCKDELTKAEEKNKLYESAYPYFNPFNI